MVFKNDVVFSSEPDGRRLEGELFQEDMVGAVAQVVVRERLFQIVARLRLRSDVRLVPLGPFHHVTQVQLQFVTERLLFHIHSLLTLLSKGVSVQVDRELDFHFVVTGMLHFAAHPSLLVRWGGRLLFRTRLDVVLFRLALEGELLCQQFRSELAEGEGADLRLWALAAGRVPDAKEVLDLLATLLRPLDDYDAQLLLRLPFFLLQLVAQCHAVIADQEHQMGVSEQEGQLSHLPTLLLP